MDSNVAAIVCMGAVTGPGKAKCQVTLYPKVTVCLVANATAGYPACPPHGALQLFHLLCACAHAQQMPALEKKDSKAVMLWCCNAAPPPLHLVLHLLIDGRRCLQPAHTTMIATLCTAMSCNSINSACIWGRHPLTAWTISMISANGWHELSESHSYRCNMYVVLNARMCITAHPTAPARSLADGDTNCQTASYTQSDVSTTQGRHLAATAAGALLRVFPARCCLLGVRFVDTLCPVTGWWNGRFQTQGCMQARD